jgi:hypothetical protein
VPPTRSHCGSGSDGENRFPLFPLRKEIVSDKGVAPAEQWRCEAFRVPRRIGCWTARLEMSAEPRTAVDRCSRKAAQAAGAARRRFGHATLLLLRDRRPVELDFVLAAMACCCH